MSVGNPHRTEVALSTSQDTTVFGEAVTFPADVSVDAPGAGVPTGLVHFLANGQEIGSASLDGNGEATLTTSSLAPGTYAITAVYDGYANNTGSTSPNLTQTVTRPTRARPWPRTRR